jgi:hypothetical protein
VATVDRREFLKGGLAGLFAAMLSGLGIVKAKEPEPETVHVQFTESETVFRYVLPPVSDELLIDAELGPSPFVRLEPEEDALFEDKTTDTLFGYPIVWVEEPEPETVFKYRWFFAETDSDLVDIVLCDGQDITDRCTRFYGPEQPRTSGYGVAYVVDDPAKGDENGNVIQHIIRGTIEWSAKELNSAPMDFIVQWYEYND